MGVMVIAGWACCDAWQHWPVWGEEQYTVAAESLRTQVRRMAPHPSVILFMYGSDVNPIPRAEENYLKVFRDERWSSPIVASAANDTSAISGPTGVKMSGPYAWVPPRYWLEGADKRLLGGSFGFLTEGGPGAAVMPFESMLKVAPESELQDPATSKVVNFHTGNPAGLFYDLRFYNPPLEQRYGVARTTRDYFDKAQLAAYEAQRSFFEGYSARKYQATGVIQWMLNSAWPSNYWNLFDFFLNAGGGFYGAKKGCEDLHPTYNWVDGGVSVVSSRYSQANVTLTASLHHPAGEELWNTTTTAAVGPDSATGTLVKLPPMATPALLRLRLWEGGAAGAAVSDQVYWLPVEDDKLDWDNSTFYITYCTRYADHTYLEEIPAPALRATAQLKDKEHVEVSLSATAATLAFFTRLRLVSPGGEDVLPSEWEDNYVTVFPGETRVVTVRVEEVPAGASVVARAWNGEDVVVAVGPSVQLV